MKSSPKSILSLCGVAFTAFSLFACDGGESKKSTSKESNQASSVEEIDMNKFPNYVEDYENLEYSFENKQKQDPYFLGNVIYNETAMLTENTLTGGGISATLRYKPLKILSVRDYTWETEYSADDYEVVDNKLVFKTTTNAPYWKDTQLNCQEDFPSPYVKVNSLALSNTKTDYFNQGYIYTESDIFYGRQLNVSYVYDVRELNEDVLPEYSLDKLPNLKAKLEAHDQVNMVTVGDSISEGCSSSYKFNHAPYMHGWVDQLADVLAEKYVTVVNNVNQSVGGKESSYTSESQTRLEAIVKQNPDILFVHYGTNDRGANITPRVFSEHIETIIKYVQENSPKTDIVLLTPIMPNPSVYDSGIIGEYGEKLSSLASEYTTTEHGVVYVDMTSIALDYMSEGKTYNDLTANGINHPNDYGHRLYVGALSRVLVGDEIWKQ